MKKNIVLITLLMALAALTVKADETKSKDQFVVHEWGTFTSLQGSDGNVVGGLQHEEESLPAFVAGRDLLKESVYVRPKPGCYKFKNVQMCDDVTTDVRTPITPDLVTQKMETPVLYFYSDRQKQVEVTVDFPKGLISQYYPAPVSFFPSLGNIQGLSGGSTTYHIDVVTEKLKLPEVANSNVYGPARNVNSNDIRSGDQNERFIFYRGLGNFKTDLSITSALNEGLKVNNQSQNKISDVILLNVTSQGGNIKSLGSVEAFQKLSVSEKDIVDLRTTVLANTQFNEIAEKQIVTALKKSGLYDDEALAMFNTWKKSYLKTEGFRLLYVLNRNETDLLLPIQIKPMPQELVRTLVGRIEIFTPSEEAQLLELFKQDAVSATDLARDRFIEPKLRRLLNLTTDLKIKSKISDLILKIKS